ncbi:hypothetical protein INT46_007984, partial [Mucor plumbeus]
MFKEKIHDILRRVWKCKKEIEKEHDEVRCKDCNKSGHHTKRSSQLNIIHQRLHMVNTYIFIDIHDVEDRTAVYNNPVRNIV